MRVLTPIAGQFNQNQTSDGTTIRQVGGFIRFNGVNDHQPVYTIDTTDMIISMYTREAYGPPLVYVNGCLQAAAGASDPGYSHDLPVPTVTFTLTAYFVDPRLFPAIVLWSGTTSDPFGGFSLPRKTFAMTTQIEADIAYLDLTATVPNCTFAYTVGSVIRACTLLPPAITAGTTTIAPISYNLEDLPIYIDIGLYQDISESPSIIADVWIVASHPYAHVSDIPGVSITPYPDLKVRFDQNTCYNGRMYIIAKNTVEALKAAIGFDINVVATPRIVQPVNPIIYSMTSTRFAFPLVYNAAAGQLVWNITLLSSPVPYWLIISNDGVVIVERGGAVNDIISITGTNSAGGSCTVSTLLNIAQTPIITPVPGGVVTYIAVAYPTEMSFTLSTESPLAIVATDATLLIPDAAGDLTLPSNAIVQLSGQTTNLTGTLFVSGSLQVTGTGAIYAANITVDNPISSTAAPIKMSIAQSAWNNAVVEWSMYIHPPSDPSIIIAKNAITINQLTGRIIVANNQYIPGLLITVTATNKAGGSGSTTFTLRVAQTPVIDPATTHILTNVNGATYSQALTQTATATGLLTWSMTYTQKLLSNALISLSLDGYLTVSLVNGHLDPNTVSITVTNPLGGSATALYTIELYQQPIIVPPDLVYSIPAYLLMPDDMGNASVFANMMVQLNKQQQIVVPGTLTVAGSLQVTGTSAIYATNVIVYNADSSYDIPDYTYALQDAAAPNSGIVTWALVSNNVQLRINPTTGVISHMSSATVAVHDYITVAAQGPLLLPPTTLTFFANVQRTPSFVTNYFGISPNYQLITVLESQTDAVINLPDLLQVDMTCIYALTWTITYSDNVDRSAIVNLDPASGIITVSYDHTFTSAATITASNDAGGSDSITFSWQVAQAVNLINPGRLVATTNLSDYTYVLFQNATNVGMIAWSLSPIVEGVSIPDATRSTLLCAKNNYINQDFTVSTLSAITGDVRSTTFNVCIAQQPYLTNPGPVTGVMFASNFSFNLGDHVTTVGTGPLTWHITAYPSLSIDNTGAITYEVNNSINTNVTVTVYTVTGAKSSQTFILNVAQATQLLVDNTVTANMNYKSPFVFRPVKAGSIAGVGNTSEWALVPAPPTDGAPADGVVTINTISGEITVLYDNRVYQNYTVTLTQFTIVNGQREYSDPSSPTYTPPKTKTFLLNVSQMPVLVFPETTYSYSFAQGDVAPLLDMNPFLKAVGTGQITWALSPAPLGISLSKTSPGVLVISRNANYYNGPLNLVVKNATGGTTTPPVIFILAQTPVFVASQSIQVSVAYDAEYISVPIRVIATLPLLATGPLTWTITSAFSNVTIDQDGCIHVAAGTCIEALTGVTIRATNPAGGYAEATDFPLVVARAAILTPPPSTITIPYGTAYSYQIAQTRAGAGTLVWSITPATGLTIDSTGTVTLAAQAQVYTNITVYVQNRYLTSSTPVTTSFDLHIISAPVIASISNVKHSTLTSAAFTQAVQAQTTANTCTPGVLTWQITSVSGLSIIATSPIVSIANYSTANVILQNGYWINQYVTVSATNALNQVSEVTFLMQIASAPILIQDTIRTTLTTLTNYQYQVQVTQTPDQTGPLVWVLSNIVTSSATQPNISIDPNSGLITLLYGSYFSGSVNVTATSVGGISSTITLAMAVYFAFVFPSIPSTGLVINRTNGVINPYTDIAIAALHQAAGTGVITWSIETSIDADVPILHIGNGALSYDSHGIMTADSSGNITYAADNLMLGARITVAAVNPLQYLIRNVFDMTVATTPLISAPGSLYLTGTSVRGFQYPFTNIASFTGGVIWETSVLDGLSIDANTGIMQYDNSNIYDQNIQYLTSTSPSTSLNTSNIDTVGTAMTFVPTDTNTILTAPYLYVAENCTWNYTSNQNQVPTLVMNQSLGTSVFSFPTNVIWSRTFQVTATNAALGYDVRNITLNLDGIRVPVPLETLLSLRDTAVVTNRYSIASSDLNRGKVLPPAFLPSISGATTLTFTWPTASLPIADVYFVWTPITIESETLAPVCYRHNSPSPSISVPGFSVSTPYVFEFTCIETSTTITNVLTATTTPSYRNISVTMATPTGATTVTLSWTITDSNIPTIQVATPVSITWSPDTMNNQPSLQAAGITTATIGGFLPSTLYTFTVTASAGGVYAGTTASTTYNTNYKDLSPYITVYPLQSLNTGNNTVVTLYMNFTALSATPLIPPPVTDVVLVLTPTDLLYPIVTVSVPTVSQYITASYRTQHYNSTPFVGVGSSPAQICYTSCVTLGLGAATQLVLGQKYSVAYTFVADPTGVYAPYTLNVPIDMSVGPYLILQNDLVVTTSPPTGGTKITFYWTTSYPTACTITWTDSNGNLCSDSGAAVGVTQYTSSGDSILGPFEIGTSYVFTLAFAATAAYASATVTLNPFVPQYKNSSVTVYNPQYVDSSSVLLAWSFDQSPATTCTISYPPPVGSVTVQSQNVTVNTLVTQTSVTVPNLVLGYTYTLGYFFNPDPSGTYGPFPYEIDYTMKTHNIAPVITITGGTALKIVWQLYAVASDNSKVAVTGSSMATISWVPATTNIPSGTTQYSSGVTISGFTLDSATRYRFTFNFQETDFHTLLTSYVYPPALPALTSLVLVGTPIVSATSVSFVVLVGGYTISTFTSATQTSLSAAFADPALLNLITTTTLRAAISVTSVIGASAPQSGVLATLTIAGVTGTQAQALSSSVTALVATSPQRSIDPLIKLVSGILPHYYAATITSMTAQGYASLYSPSYVSVKFNWTYGYTDNTGVFVPVITTVNINWDNASLTKQPFVLTSQADDNSVTIPDFNIGSTYNFTFLFMPDPSGMTQLYTYVYPQSLTLSYPLVDTVNVSNNGTDLTTLLVTWNVTPATAVTVSAVTSVGRAITGSVAAGVQSIILYGVVSASYQVTITFAQTATTLQFMDILEFNNSN